MILFSSLSPLHAFNFARIFDDVGKLYNAYVSVPLCTYLGRSMVCCAEHQFAEDAMY